MTTREQYTSSSRNRMDRCKKIPSKFLLPTVRPVPYPFRRLLPPEERPCTCSCASIDSRRRFSRGSRDGRGFGRAQKSSKRVLRNAVSRGGERLPSRRAVAERLVGRFILRIRRRRAPAVVAPSRALTSRGPSGRITSTWFTS